MSAVARERRAYQAEVLKALQKRRLFFLLWRRQGGKSVTLAEMALLEMMQQPGRTVTYVSASLLLGREIIYKEVQVWQQTMAWIDGILKAGQMKISVADAQTHKLLQGLSAEDMADLFESQRLEFRIYHSETSYSRTMVIAPNVATARGWTGTVLLDEFGFIRDFRDLMEAVEPIVSTNPDFKLIGATTPPKDDGHYSYELCAPPVGAKFEARAAGNWYQSQCDMPVHRVDILDAAAAGVKIYDLKSGKALTPEAFLAGAADRDAALRNYWIKFLLGGTSAVDAQSLSAAQEKGVGSCHFAMIEEELDLVTALDWLKGKLGNGAVGLGWDLATTEQEASNPSALCVMERVGIEYYARLVLGWKTADPDLAAERVQRVVEVVAGRKEGGRARRLAIDATNERYFAAAMQKKLRGKVAVDLVVGSEKVEMPAAEEMNLKAFTGNALVNGLQDGHVVLPPERYIKEDFRLVKKAKGSFECDVAPDGKHGDTFDGVKLAYYALTKRGQDGVAVAVGVGGYKGGML